MANRDNSSVLAGCYRELSSGMNEAGCRLYLRPRANSPDKAGKPQSGQMRVHVLCTEACPKIIYLPGGDTRGAHRRAPADNALRTLQSRSTRFIGLSKLSAALTSLDSPSTSAKDFLRFRRMQRHSRVEDTKDIIAL